MRSVSLRPGHYAQHQQHGGGPFRKYVVFLLLALMFALLPTVSFNMNVISLICLRTVVLLFDVGHADTSDA